MNAQAPANEELGFWVQRLDATGRAQARYLWILLVAGLFYAALRARGSSSAITVPIIDLELDASTVLASGGPVLAFVVLIVVGAIRAWTHALEQVRGTVPATDAEPLDAHPNAIDLAVYTTDRSPAILRRLLSLVYPVFLTAGLAESVWLGWWAWSERIPPRPILVGVMAITWLPAALLVLGMWRSRFRQYRKRGSTV